MMRGALYVAYGAPAQREAQASIDSLHKWHPELPIAIVGDGHLTYRAVDRHIYAPDSDIGARWAKLSLDLLAPATWQHILYLDADTLVRQRVDAGFQALEDGWDLALAASVNQRGMILGCQDLLWHVQPEEREATLIELGHSFPLQLQCGVMFINRPTVTTLFATWREEWQRWRDQDQGAFLRALHRCPVRIHLLGRCWNGGAIIEHRFGRAARRR